MVSPDRELQTAVDLLGFLQTLLEQNIPLHKVILRVEVGDPYYDGDLYQDNVYIETYKDREGVPTKYLVFKGPR